MDHHANLSQAARWCLWSHAMCDCFLKGTYATSGLVCFLVTFLVLTDRKPIKGV